MLRILVRSANFIQIAAFLFIWIKKPNNPPPQVLFYESLNIISAPYEIWPDECLCVLVVLPLSLGSDLIKPTYTGGEGFAKESSSA